MRAADGAIFPLRPLGLVVCLALAACGVGGGEADGRSGSAVAAEAPDGVAEALSGTVVFRTQGDKTTVDGWFVPATAAESDASGPTAPADDCTVADALTPSRLRGEAVSRPGGSTAFEGRYVGDSLPLTSRGGVHGVLRAQRLGGMTVYATAERWLRGELPDDLMLDVPDAGGGFAPVSVPPLEPLTVSSPANGVLASVRQAIEWLPSDDASDHVVLELTAADVDAPSEALVSIRCRLLDDGRFVLPETLLARLPAEPDGAHVHLIRERRVDVRRDAHSLRLIQQRLP